MKYTLTIVFVLLCSNVYAGPKLVWDASPNSLLGGYNVYIGTESRVYGNPIDVSTNTEYVFTNLSGNERMYFAVTAYDVDGNESFYSEEVVYFPVIISNVRIVLDITIP